MTPSYRPRSSRDPEPAALAEKLGRGRQRPQVICVVCKRVHEYVSWDGTRQPCGHCCSVHSPAVKS